MVKKMSKLARAQNLQDLGALLDPFCRENFGVRGCLLYGLFRSYSAPFIRPLTPAGKADALPVNFAVGEGLTGRTFVRGESVIYNNPLANKRFNRDYDDVLHLNPDILGCYPFHDRKHQEVIGCLNLYWAAPRRRPARRRIAEAVREMEPFYRLLYLQREQELLIGMMLDHLLIALEQKDRYTKGHADRVAAYAFEVGKQLGLNPPQLAELRDAAHYHDIGKIFIDEKILNKPGRLNDEEWLAIRRHSVFAKEFLYKHRHGATLLPAIIAHHEKIDGTGYPYGKKREQIPLSSQIISVCDVFDAMTSRRIYRQGQKETAAKAVAALRQGVGCSHPKEIVDAFCAVHQAGLIDLARGRHHAKNGDLRAALIFYRAAKSKAQRCDPGKTDRRLILADVHYQMGAALGRVGQNMRQAKQILAKGLTYDPDNPYLLAALAQAHYFSQELDSAIRVARQAIARAFKPEHWEALGLAKQISGLAYALKNQLPQAEELLRQAMNIFQTLGKDEELAKIYDSYGNVLLRACRFAEAEVFLQYSEEIKLFHQDMAGLAITYGNLGRLHTYLENYEEAISFFKRNLAIAAAVPDHRGISLCNGYLARIALARECYDEAEEYLRAGQAAAGTPLGDFFACLTGIDLSLVKADLMAAKDGLAAAKKLVTQNKLTRFSVLIDTYTARIFSAEGRHPAARQAIESALKFSHSQHNQYELLPVYEAAGDIARAQGDFLAAVRFDKTARRLAKQYGLPKVSRRINEKINAEARRKN